MTFWTLIRASVRHHARSHVGVVLGAAVGAAVLVGALAVGDSIRHSLSEMALSRLGRIRLALNAGDRLFRAELAKSLEDPMDATVAAVLRLPGSVAREDGSARANQVQIVGVDPQFWALGYDGQPDMLPGPGDVWLNENLARQLQVKAGETLVLRTTRPSQLSRDAPVSAQEDAIAAFRAKVAGILKDRQMGRFSLQASQVPPPNAFVSRSWLQETLKLKNQANLILVGGSAQTSVDNANASVQRAWNLADGEMEIVPSREPRAFDLRTSRVFIETPVGLAARKAFARSEGFLTYFVNEIRAGSKSTPYSMVTATDAGWLPGGLKEDEIVVTQWLADDLSLKPGDAVSLSYFVVGAMRNLVSQTNQFKVRAVLPEAGPHDDPGLMPEFPGLAKAKNCRDWDAGFPVDFEKIREKDNLYWEKRKGTPKAFLSLAAGQRIWGNRFGDLTSVRYSNPEGDVAKVGESLRKSIDPGLIGLRFEDVRASAQAAVAGGQDFGQLFIGFSFFLVAAAMILTSLLFQFGIDRRNAEVGLLLALGWRPEKVRFLFLLEGGVLAGIGAAIGVLGGMGYARAMLWGLSTLWRDAVGTAALQYHASPATLLAGAVAGWLTAWITLVVAIRKMASRQARELLLPELQMESEIVGSTGAARSSRRLTWMIHGSRFFGVLLVIAGASRPAAASGCFFGAGALFLVSGMGSLSRFFAKLELRVSTLADVTGLAIRNLARRPRRSLSVAGLLACGSFMIIAVSANRLEAGKDATSRSSGTGGFALWGESSLAVVHDLNARDGRDFHNLDPKILQGVSIVPFRVREGEDASCLNLNRAQQPRLVAVQPGQLDERRAFAFSSLLDKSQKEHPWLALKYDRSHPDEVPAIGDAASIQWALGKSVGDSLDYVDHRGRPFKVRIVGAVSGSILQGQLVVSEEAFVEKFPLETGYRMFLVDCPSDRMNDVRAHLSKALQDSGLEVTGTVERLAAFNAVQNTYLNTFQVLGGLGLLLGSVGVGVVVLRTVLERRFELALLRATGWSNSLLQSLILREHLLLFVLGMVTGVLAAAVAVLPAIANPGSGLPLASLGITLGVVLLNGMLWVFVTTWSATRGELLEPLRQNQ